ncbi:cytochrome P450 [Saccharopolyspora sp. K220]|uniref:cytochrome P450 n=1 Tax=Saccharopolyspora soli TaxID=2926618 RepID=UPI001F5808AE|nr:cytochrome P450 [Saccharopolyspora soli]MCI2423015.1 cytochrome P450 [Saccharopolyspora soli]
MGETLQVPAPYPMRRAAGCPFDPPPDLARIQREAPVTRVRIWDGSTPWLVTRYADVRAVLADPRVSAESDAPGYPPVTVAFQERRRRSRNFVAMDDPEHAAQRRLLTADFMVKKMESLRPRIQQIVDELLDEMLAGPKPVDLVQAFALPVPSLVICTLLGVPYEQRNTFHRLSKVLVSRDATAEEGIAATEELLAFLEKVIEQKNADPGDDILSRLVVTQLRTGAMTRREIASLGQLLLVAGHETTANMIALGTVALLQNPDQLAELRDTEDPKLVAGAVEELLRYLTIVHFGRRRTALEDIEIGGQLIRKGEGIIAATDVANRDRAAFDDPDALDIHRPARHHITFGYGVHQCLGQPLARVELQVAYPALLRRIPTLRLAAPVEELPFKTDMLVYGVHELPVTW